MVGWDVVEISWMRQDSVLFQQLGGCLLFITGNRYRYIEAAFRFDKGNSFQTFYCALSTMLYPILVGLRESDSPPKHLRYGKLCDFVHWQKRIRDEFESSHGFLHKAFL